MINLTIKSNVGMKIHFSASFIVILGFHVTSEKLKLKILSFYLYQVKAIFNHISVGLFSAR